MIVNRANLNDLFVAFNAAFKEGFGRAKSEWQLIAMLTTSTTDSEHYAWLGQWPGLREWIGERLLKQLASYDYRIKNKDFESTVVVKRNDIDDDKYGVYTPMMQEMGLAAATHPDELVFGLLKAGFATPCYDGQFFFDTDHPVGRELKASVSNFGGGAGTPWFLIDTSRAMKPLIFQKRKDYMFEALNKSDDDHVFKNKEFLYGVDARVNVGFGLWQLAYASKQALDETNFNAAYAALESLKSDEGRPLGVRATHLVVAPSQREAALKIVRDYGTSGESNVNRNLVKVLDTPWLA